MSPMFPLPLTCFEEYMLCDDRPAYPMSGVFRLRFCGFLQRAEFEAALADTVRRHPLLRATVSRTPGRRSRWIDHPDWRPVVQWQTDVTRYGFPHVTHIDLTEEPGTRVWVADRDEPHNDGHDVFVQLHHCCADALGASKVFEDLLIGYALNLKADIGCTSLPALDPRRLLQRGAPALTAWKLLKMAHKQAAGLLGVREFLSRSPVPLAAPDVEIDGVSPPPVFPAPRTYRFDPTDTKRLITTAKSLGVTVNDLLVRDLFIAAGVWRQKNGVGSDRDWLRCSIPIGLRTAADETMPMTNSVSMVFLDRRAEDFSDSSRLLQGIHRQMQLIRRLQLQYTFIFSLAVSRMLPGGLRRMTRADQCRATSCFSNIGVVFARTPLPRRRGLVVSGNVVLEAADFVIPLRPQLNAAFCVYTYGGRLTVLMHYDPRRMTDQQSEELLGMYIERIHGAIAKQQ